MARSAPNRRVRGSRTGRPIMLLLDQLGRRWTLRILWELQGDSLTFRELQQRCDEIAPSVLNTRLRELRQAGLIRHVEGHGYAATPRAEELRSLLAPLDAWAKKWARTLPGRSANQGSDD